MCVPYAVFSALFGSTAVVFIKIGSAVLFNLEPGIFDGGAGEKFGSWFFWVMLVGFGCMITIWMSRLNEGLKYFDAIVFIPIIQSNFILWSVSTLRSGIPHSASCVP